MVLRVAILDLLCVTEVYGPMGNAEALRRIPDLEVLALNPQFETGSLPSRGEWDGIPFSRATMDDVDRLDALLISGSKANLTIPEPWMEDAKKFVRNQVIAGVPTLGICFGHQLLAEAFGGRLVRAEEGFHNLSEVAVLQDDPLLAGCGRNHLQLFTHQDHVVEFPQDAIHLASAGHCQNAAFRLISEDGQPYDAWGVQFHPESNQSILEYAVEKGDMPFKMDDPRISMLKGWRVLQNFADVVMAR